MHIPEAGRGRALTRAWLASDADVLAYMDIDLSTDLDAFPTLVSAVAEQGYDVAAGTRLGAGSETTRSLKREVLSRGFVLMINVLFRHAACATRSAASRRSAASARRSCCRWCRTRAGSGTRSCCCWRRRAAGA